MRLNFLSFLSFLFRWRSAPKGFSCPIPCALVYLSAIVFDNTTKVYKNGQLAASFGGSGATPASFNRITSLWLEQNLLYVTDSLNRRV